jgi:ribosomal protein L12E/L44/L45/RPP1/RPP2
VRVDGDAVDGSGARVGHEHEAPAAGRLGGDEGVGHLAREHFTQLAFLQKALLDQDRAQRLGLVLLLVEGLAELRLVDERALEELAAEHGVGEDARRIARLGDAAVHEVDVDEALRALDVQCAGAPGLAEHLQDLYDAEGVECTLHESLRPLIGASPPLP